MDRNSQTEQDDELRGCDRLVDSQLSPHVTRYADAVQFVGSA